MTDQIKEYSMHYKSHTGIARFHSEDKLFYGKIEFIRDLVTYEAADVESLKEAFHEAIDSYLGDKEND